MLDADSDKTGWRWKGIAWDIDGTLIDSEPLHLDSLLAVSARHGVDLSGEPDDHFRGMHMSDVWTALAPRYPESLTEEQWNAEIEEFYCTHADSLTPIPGARATIEALAARGIRQVCVSNSLRRVVDVNIARLGFADCFTGTVSFSDVTAGKPDPEPYMRGAALLHLAPQDVLAVEDSATGIASAKAAGLTAAAFVPGDGTLPGADLTIRRLDDLLTL